MSINDSVLLGKETARTVSIIMNQNCNIGCPYCFQPKEFKQNKTAITKEVLDSIVRWSKKTFKKEKITYNLFGGEPFLNFPMIKYICEKYPELNYETSTNGLVLLENKDILKWVTKHAHHLKVTFTISSLRFVYGKSYLEKSRPILDVLIANYKKHAKKRFYFGEKITYVVEDPERPKIYDEIVWLFEYGAPLMHIKHINLSDVVHKKNKQYRELFRRIADYIYFTGKPKLMRSSWDLAFTNNIYRKIKGTQVPNQPPTNCGGGEQYFSINHKGEIFPCEAFAYLPQFSIGDVYNGFKDLKFFFRKMREWNDGLYENCKDCKHCPEGDIRCCPCMCFWENYIVSGNILKPAPNRCWGNNITTSTFEYIAKKAIESGVDELVYALLKKSYKNG